MDYLRMKKAQLIEEIETLQGKMAGLEHAQAERKRAEETLRESEKRYRLLLESISDSVYVLDREWRHVVVNDAAERFVQIPKETLLGGKLTDLFPGVEETEFFKVFQWVMETRKPDIVVNEYTFEGGRKGWYEVRVYPVPEGILCMVEDKLLGAARQWRTTFDGIRDAVCLSSLERNVLRCNMAMKNLLGKPFNEIIGRPCWELVHGTSEPVEGCPHVRMRETRRRETMVLPMGDRWWDISVDPVLDEDGDLVGAAHIIADITERKRAEETIEQMAYHDDLTGLPNRRLFNDQQFPF